MIDKFKSYLESIKITPINWLVGISGVLMVRFFIESFTNKTSSGFFSTDASTLLHYSLFFLCIFVAHLIIFGWIMTKWKQVIPQFIVVTSLFIFVAPIADWILSGGEGFKMTYFFDLPKDMLMRFLTFGNIGFGGGATPGLQIEIGLMLLFFVSLVHLVQRNWKNTIFSAIAFLVPVFFFPALPGILSAISQIGNFFQINPLGFFLNTIVDSSTVANNLHSSLDYSSTVRLAEVAFNFMMSKVLLLILVILTSFWFYKNFREKFKALFSDLRLSRTLHGFFMITLGLFSAFIMFPQIKLNWNDWLSVIMLFLSFFFAIRFSICANDFFDQKIDAITNKNRPLVRGALTESDMKQAAFLFFITSLLFGFLAGYTAFFFVLAFIALYFIYSAPPTRFKLIPFLSSFLISLCALTAVAAGFYLISPLKQVAVFPDKFILAIILFNFLHSHIRDLKDVEGDKTLGIRTVPVLFGKKWGVRVAGVLSSLAFLLIPIFLGSHIILVAAIPAALANYYFATKKPFREKPLFLIYFGFIMGGFLLLFL